MDQFQAPDNLRQQLDTADQSLLFLRLLIFSILLSYQALSIQRQQLNDTITGNTETEARQPRVFPLRLGASALVVGALGFFLCLALDTLRSVAPEDCVAKQSAQTNAVASLLVFLAGLLRLDDLLRVERNQSALLMEDDLPD